MASKKEIERELSIALEEIGKITPWYEEDCDSWVFSHPWYPVEYGGKTKREVIENFPKYMREFIMHRLDNNLEETTEIKTKGRGGARPGAGRPPGTAKEPKARVYLPLDIADWLKDPSHLEQLRRAIHYNR